MKAEKTKGIYDMNLHEALWLDIPSGGKHIIRVASGWIYHDWDSEKDESINPVFVPFDNSFLN